jgi:hypothetical protein
MCFSATASFTAAAITGVIGLVTLSRVPTRAELPLAAVPLLFALQQTIEGCLWLTLDDGIMPGLGTPLTYGFLLLAEVWWPIFVPIAVLLAEPDPRRRRLMLVPLGLGVGAGLFLLWSILTHAHQAAVIDEHIVYVSERPYPFILGAAYFIGTVLPPLLSSRRTVAVLGLIVLVGAAIAYVAYWQAFVSVWCFFAAAASGVILFHFERLRRTRQSGITT